MSSILQRMIRAAKLDSSLYEEVEIDHSAYGQALAVILISSVSAGVGSVRQIGLSGIMIGTIGALAGWYIWAILTFLIGTRILPQAQTSATLGQLLRTIGFSSSPGVFRVLGIIPGVGLILVAIVNAWMLIAMVIAVRQALDYSSTLRAIGVCLIGWVIQIAVLAAFFGLFVQSRPAAGF
jgi:hypothetical protein